MNNGITGGRVEHKRSLLNELISPVYQTESLLTELAAEFREEGYIRLAGLLSPQAFSALNSEIEEQVTAANSRNFIMEGYGTPRQLSVMGGSTLLRNTDLIWTLYAHWELRRLITRLTGSEVYSCLHPDEFMVANFLLERGDTHGWHLDDPAYALIIFFAAPAPEDGGVIEYIPHWRAFCESVGTSPEHNVDRTVELARERGLIRLKHHNTGDAYLLRADQALHRVTGLKRDGIRRIVLNLAFEASSSPVYGNTASILYGESQ